MIGFGILGLVSKLHKWDESAMLFDGSSLGPFPRLVRKVKLTRLVPVAFVVGVAVYTTVTIPTLRTIVTPLEEDTRLERVEAMRVLSAGNVIIAGCLGAILLLQVCFPDNASSSSCLT